MGFLFSRVFVLDKKVRVLFNKTRTLYLSVFIGGRVFLDLIFPKIKPVRVLAPL